MTTIDVRSRVDERFSCEHTEWEWRLRLTGKQRRFYKRKWWEQRSSYWQELAAASHSEEQRQWWDWYAKYLLTPAWQARRQKVLRRAAGLCEGCLERDATQVHHLTYDHVGNEPLFDLVAICDECHRSITEHDRARRGQIR